MIVLDSSAWIEYFRGGSLAPLFLTVVEDHGQLLIPSIAIYEVHKWMLLKQGETQALNAKAFMLKSKVIVLDPPLAEDASRLSIEHKLPMADAIIYATTLANAAQVWTTDNHFKGLPNVRYFERN